MHISILLFVVLFVPCSSYKTYQERIPNGPAVPHPCKPNYLWKGVGHLSASGGGRRNPFGTAFETLGKNWSEELCRADSDGDGRSNGEELGDPNCNWQPGQIPEITTGITHPGVCEPFDSPACKDKNSWVNCEKETLKCPALNEPDVMTLDVRMPNISVPINETFYMCSVMNIPDIGEDYHIIGITPLIDNEYVIHHSTIMGCQTPDAGSKFSDEPKECGMSGFGESCTELVGVWTLGSPGHCFHENVGVKIGKTGLKRVLIQNHYTNPEGRLNWYDNSGVRLYYTRKLRKYEGGSWTIGQQSIEIPPGVKSMDVVGHCKPECTKKMDQSIFIVDGLMHAHYLGTGITVQHARGGQNFEYVINEVPYSYDNPIFHTMKEPLEIRPGDQLTVKCSYQSTNRKTHTSWGLGTYDEMCYAIFFYYPRVDPYDLPLCVPFKEVPSCDVPYKGCSHRDFNKRLNVSSSALYQDVLNHCSVGQCNKKCALAMRRARSEPCLQGDNLGYERWGSTFAGGERERFHKLFDSMSGCRMNPHPFLSPLRG